MGGEDAIDSHSITHTGQHLSSLLSLLKPGHQSGPGKNIMIQAAHTFNPGEVSQRTSVHSSSLKLIID